LLNIVLADCDLELTPETLFGHPSVKSYSKKMGEEGQEDPP
jgi:rRNA pseudouridine-1189 N-methylase Emg1 (Nep1/Mra1 family)